MVLNLLLTGQKQGCNLATGTDQNFFQINSLPTKIFRIPTRIVRKLAS